MWAGIRLTKPDSKQACKANSSEFGLNACGAHHFFALFNLELLIPQFRTPPPLLLLPTASTSPHISTPNFALLRIKGLKRGRKYGMIKISIFILLFILEGSIGYETEYRRD